MKTRKPYPTDLTDKEWERIETLLPPRPKMGRPLKYDRRELFDAIWYVLRTGCAWRYLPHDFPPWQTVYAYFRLLKRQGIWEQLNTQLRQQVRQNDQRHPEPSLLIADSQSVKTTEKGGLVAMMGGN